MRTYRHPSHHRRGVVLITVMWIVIALTAVVLVLCREMSVEYKAAAQHLDGAKADAAERGVESFVLSSVAGELVTPGFLDNLNYEQRELGDCYWWILRPNPNDEQTPDFGLTDEAGKLDLNTATYDQLIMLPNMTEQAADSIIDWRDSDDDVTNTDGAEDQYYMALNPAYHCKNAPFESLGELGLVAGIDNDLLYGADRNHNGTVEPQELQNANAGVNFDSSARGIYPCLTVYGVKATTAATTSTASTDTAVTTQQPVDINSNTNRQQLQTLLSQYLPGKVAQIQQRMQPGAVFTSIWSWAVQMDLTSSDMTQLWDATNQRYYVMAILPQGANGAGGTGGATTVTTTPTVAKVNLNTASLAVLQCLVTSTRGLTQSDAQAIVSYRQNTSIDPTQKGNISWILDVLQDKTVLTDIGAMITGSTNVYSADIVTVTRDGRAFKRVKIVVDASSGTPQIIYRRDLSAEGWPLDPAIRESLRRGEGLDSPDNRASRNNGLSMGLH